MKQFNKDIYLIDPGVLENLLKQPPVNPSIFLDGIKSQSIKGSIVLTIEELAQLWNAGHSAGMEDAGATLRKPAVDFEAYLESKGIKMEEPNGK
jgi:hypothetical protein